MAIDAHLNCKREFVANIVVTVALGVLLLFFQYLKHKWRISQPEHWTQWVTVLHAELCFFIPIAIIFIAVRPLRNYLFFILTAYSLLGFCDYVTWMTMTRPMHPIDILRAIEFVQYYWIFVKKFFLKILLIFLAPVILYMFRLYVLKSKNRTWTDAIIERFPEKGFAAVFLGIYLLFIPIAARANYFSYNSVVKIAKEIMYEHELKTQKIKDEELNRLLGLRDGKHTTHAALLDRCAKKNIVLFIIETAPYKYYYDLDNYLKLKGFENLRSNTLAFSEHYSTYPESDRAFYSILTGKYPPLSRGNAWIQRSGFKSALPNILKQHGYESFLVSTAPLNFQNNRVMMEKMGFDHIREIDKTKKAFQMVEGKRRLNREELYDADLELMDEAISIMKRRKHPGESPYLLVLLPQASHAPFQKPPGAQLPEDATDEALVQANVAWQYALIGKLLETLETDQMLDDVSFFITGDHGIRSLYESKELFSKPHILNSVSFHVPLWIIDRDAKEIISPAISTSHIDIVPTLLDLLCIDYDPHAYHGRSMSINGDRFIFFLGGDYLPVSGFKFKHLYYMENRLRNIMDVNTVFRFPSAKKTPISSKTERSQSRFPVDVAHNLALIKTLLLNDSK